MMKRLRLREVFLTRDDADNATTMQEFLKLSGPVLNNLNLYLSKKQVMPSFDLEHWMSEAAQHCPNLKTVKIVGGASAGYKILTTPLEIPPQVQTLTLKQFHVCMDTLDAIIESRTLVHLRLDRSIYTSYYKYYDQNRYLQSLDTESALWTKYFPNLTTITLSAPRQDDLTLLLANCPLIRNATLHINVPVNFTQVHEISRRWTHLEHLHLTGRTQVMPELLVCELISLCPRLITLHTFQVRSSVEFAPTIYPRNCNKSRLRTLALYCSTAPVLLFMVQNCPYLDTLHLRECEEQIAANTQNVTTSLDCLQQANLQALYVRGYSALTKEHITQLQNLKLKALSIN